MLKESWEARLNIQSNCGPEHEPVITIISVTPIKTRCVRSVPSFRHGAKEMKGEGKGTRVRERARQM